ncbi:MAG: YwaF family protein [Bacilli bacterium]|nr:YwaF family protein [Bacilli bacterium]
MIIKPFNLVHIGVLLFTVIFTVSLSLLLRKKDQAFKDKFLIGLAIFDIIFFIAYKIWLSQDGYDFVIWKELPLQLCNINMFLIPIGVYKKNKYLLTFSFYIAPLGALMALLFPELAFMNNSIFMFRNIGFYGTHIIIIAMGVMLATLGYVEPKIKNISILLISAAVFSLGAFIVNNLFNLIVDVETNYFFVMDPSGISILELFWSWIPIKFLYLLPATVILAIYTLIIDLIYRLILFINKKITK